MTKVTKLDIVRYVYNRPTVSQALAELMKEAIRQQPGIELEGIVRMSREQHTKEMKDENST